MNFVLFSSYFKFFKAKQKINETNKQKKHLELLSEFKNIQQPVSHDIFEYSLCAINSQMPCIHYFI